MRASATQKSLQVLRRRFMSPATTTDVPAPHSPWSRPTRFARHQAPLLPLSLQCWPGASTPTPSLCSECVVPDVYDPQLEPWRWRMLMQRWLWFLLQTTVIFLVDVDKCMPTAEAWPETWAEQQKWAKAKAAHQAAAVSLHRGDRWPMRCTTLLSGGQEGQPTRAAWLGRAAVNLHSYTTSRQVCHRAASCTWGASSCRVSSLPLAPACQQSGPGTGTSAVSACSQTCNGVAGCR